MMNSEFFSSANGLHNAEAIENLAASLGLAESDLFRIREEMDKSHCNFPEAVVALGLATSERIDEIMRQRHRVIDAEVIGPVEAAIRKVSVKRRVEALETRGEATPTKRVAAVYDPYSAHSEKLRGLRTELTLRFGPSTLATTVAVVSSGRDEGRSQLAAELAVTFAQLGKPTLLVDADFRSPSQHVLFNCSNEAGLANVIANNDQPFIFNVPAVPCLHLLTAGPLPTNPLELLSNKRLEQLIESWRHHYTYMIFDTPAVTNYADALTIATLTRRVLLVARSDNTELKQVKEMLRRLSMTHAEILGSVLNKF